MFTRQQVVLYIYMYIHVLYARSPLSMLTTFVADQCWHRAEQVQIHKSESRFRATPEQFEIFRGHLPQSQGQNLALTV